MRATLALLVVLSLVACGPIRRFERFFLDPCPAQGPVPETELALRTQAVAIDEYERELIALSAEWPRRRWTHTYLGQSYATWHVGPMLTQGGPRVLVVAGIHGNEIGASLAALLVLADARRRSAAYGAVELHLVTPANPVGLEHGSRYDGLGCDPNRDFGRWRTSEARVVAEVFRAVGPRLIVSFHEGPQDGFYVVATGGASVAAAGAAAAAVEDEGIALARRGFLGFHLPDPGVRIETAVTRALKRLVRLGSLGTYADALGVGTLTTESSWSARDIGMRSRAHVVALRAITHALVTEAFRTNKDPDGHLRQRAAPPVSRGPSGSGGAWVSVRRPSDVD